jgi:hypothetical protein
MLLEAEFVRSALVASLLILSRKEELLKTLQNFGDI